MVMIVHLTVAIGVFHLMEIPANPIAFFRKSRPLVSDIATITVMLPSEPSMTAAQPDACVVDEHCLSPICLSRQMVPRQSQAGSTSCFHELKSQK
jgi:hypothetical protein